MRRTPGMPPHVCTVPGCGRNVLARGLCQTHYKQLRETGTLRPIVAQRPRRLKAVKLSGLSVTLACQEQLLRHAAERDVAVNAVVTDILEAWARGYWARNKRPRRPRG